MLFLRREVEADPDSGFETTGCTEAQLAELNGNKQCGALSDPSGPFAVCNALIPPDVFQEWVIPVCINLLWCLHCVLGNNVSRERVYVPVIWNEIMCKVMIHVCLLQGLRVWPVRRAGQWSAPLWELRCLRSSLPRWGGQTGTVETTAWMRYYTFTSFTPVSRLIWFIVI